MDYARAFAKALQALRDEGRYRVFADIRRERRRFPVARHFTQGAGGRRITVWCSNDYLGIGQNPAVLAAMHAALDSAGAGSGGTRNISGTAHFHEAPRACAPHDRQSCAIPGAAAGPLGPRYLIRDQPDKLATAHPRPYCKDQLDGHGV